MTTRTLPATKIRIEPVEVQEVEAFDAYIFSIDYGGKRDPDALVVLYRPNGERTLRVFGGATAAKQAIEAVQLLGKMESGHALG
jgi:hypothetical protein